MDNVHRFVKFEQRKKKCSRKENSKSERERRKYERKTFARLKPKSKILTYCAKNNNGGDGGKEKVFLANKHKLVYKQKMSLET